MTKRELGPLTRADLVRDLRRSVGLSGRDASRILDKVLAAITETLADQGQAHMPEVGRFMVKTTPARPGRNPKTGEEVAIPARRRPILRASKSLRTKMMAQLGEDEEDGQGGRGELGAGQGEHEGQGGQGEGVGSGEPRARDYPGGPESQAGLGEPDDSEELGDPLGSPESERP